MNWFTTLSLRALSTAALMGVAAVAYSAASPDGKNTEGTHNATLMESQPDFSKYWPTPLRYGLVFVQLRISDKGEVLEATLSEGGYHDRETERSALQIARKVRLRPATVNGKPVESNGVMPFRFLGANAYESRKVVSTEFRAEADKVQQFLEKKDFKGAQFHAEWMLSEKVRNDYEYAILQTTLADSFARNNNLHRALVVIQDVTRRSSFKVQEYTPGGPIPQVTVKDFALWRTPFELEHMLKLRFILAESQGLYLDALRAHADLQALGFIKGDDPLMPRFGELLRRVDELPELTAHIRLDDRSSWRHSLLRNQLRLTNIRSGRIEEVALNCPGYSRTLPYSAGEEILIPPGLERCEAVFKGSPGTEFDVVEMRTARAPAP
ncbi:MAG: energy transducer TonB [Steroidobacteraceae bacterium]